MTKYLILDDFDVKNKVVLVRVDFNSEIDLETKKVASDVRIRAHAETTITELETAIKAAYPEVSRVFIEAQSWRAHRADLSGSRARTAPASDAANREETS